MDLLIVGQFRSHHLPTTPEECWLWQGQTTKDGYGYIKWKRKYLLAHRLAYEIEYGDFNKELHVLHECDVRACVPSFV